MKPSTAEGMPLYLVGGGDPEKLVEAIGQVMDLQDPVERGVRLYFLGRGLLDCGDRSHVELAVAVLHESMTLGSPHAAFDLALFIMQGASSAIDVAVVVGYLQRAASGGHDAARELLETFPKPP